MQNNAAQPASPASRRPSTPNGIDDKKRSPEDGIDQTVELLLSNANLQDADANEARPLLKRWLGEIETGTLDLSHCDDAQLDVLAQFGPAIAPFRNAQNPPRVTLPDATRIAGRAKLIACLNELAGGFTVPVPAEGELDVSFLQGHDLRLEHHPARRDALELIIDNPHWLKFPVKGDGPFPCETLIGDDSICYRLTIEAAAFVTARVLPSERSAARDGIASPRLDSMRDPAAVPDSPRREAPAIPPEFQAWVDRIDDKTCHLDLRKCTTSTVAQGLDALTKWEGFAHFKRSIQSVRLPDSLHDLRLVRNSLLKIGKKVVVAEPPSAQSTLDVSGLGDIPVEVQRFGHRRFTNLKIVIDKSDKLTYDDPGSVPASVRSLLVAPARENTHPRISGSPQKPLDDVADSQPTPKQRHHAQVAGHAVRNAPNRSKAETNFAWLREDALRIIATKKRLDERATQGHVPQLIPRKIDIGALREIFLETVMSAPRKEDRRIDLRKYPPSTFTETGLDVPEIYSLFCSWVKASTSGGRVPGILLADSGDWRTPTPAKDSRLEGRDSPQPDRKDVKSEAEEHRSDNKAEVPAVPSAEEVEAELERDRQDLLTDGALKRIEATKVFDLQRDLQKGHSLAWQLRRLTASSKFMEFLKSIDSVRLPAWVTDIREIADSLRAIAKPVLVSAPTESVRKLQLTGLGLTVGLIVDSLEHRQNKLQIIVDDAQLLTLTGEPSFVARPKKGSDPDCVVVWNKRRTPGTPIPMDMSEHFNDMFEEIQSSSRAIEARNKRLPDDKRQPNAFAVDRQTLYAVFAQTVMSAPPAATLQQQDAPVLEIDFTRFERGEQLRMQLKSPELFTVFKKWVAMATRAKNVKLISGRLAATPARNDAKESPARGIVQSPTALSPLTRTPVKTPAGASEVEFVREDVKAGPRSASAASAASAAAGVGVGSRPGASGLPPLASALPLDPWDDSKRPDATAWTQIQQSPVWTEMLLRTRLKDRPGVDLGLGPRFTSQRDAFFGWAKLDSAAAREVAWEKFHDTVVDVGGHSLESESDLSRVLLAKIEDIATRGAQSFDWSEATRQLFRYLESVYPVAPEVYRRRQAPLALLSSVIEKGGGDARHARALREHALHLLQPEHLRAANHQARVQQRLGAISNDDKSRHIRALRKLDLLAFGVNAFSMEAPQATEAAFIFFDMPFADRTYAVFKRLYDQWYAEDSNLPSGAKRLLQAIAEGGEALFDQEIAVKALWIGVDALFPDLPSLRDGVALDVVEAAALEFSERAGPKPGLRFNAAKDLLRSKDAPVRQDFEKIDPDKLNRDVMAVLHPAAGEVSALAKPESKSEVPGLSDADQQSYRELRERIEASPLLNELRLRDALRANAGALNIEPSSADLPENPALQSLYAFWKVWEQVHANITAPEAQREFLKRASHLEPQMAAQFADVVSIDEARFNRVDATKLLWELIKKFGPERHGISAPVESLRLLERTVADVQAGPTRQEAAKYALYLLASSAPMAADREARAREYVEFLRANPTWKRVGEIAQEPAVPDAGAGAVPGADDKSSRSVEAAKSSYNFVSGAAEGQTFAAWNGLRELYFAEGAPNVTPINIATMNLFSAIAAAGEALFDREFAMRAMGLAVSELAQYLPAARPKDAKESPALKKNEGWMAIRDSEGGRAFKGQHKDAARFIELCDEFFQMDDQLVDARKAKLAEIQQHVERYANNLRTFKSKSSDAVVRLHYLLFNWKKTADHDKEAEQIIRSIIAGAAQ